MRGKCFCSSVRFELTKKIEDAYYCHCRDCQILSGSAFRVFGVVPTDAINVTHGELSEYKQQADSGFEMTRRFCPQCATPLFVNSTQFPDIQMFMLSALDNPESVQPSFEIWCDSKVSWSKINDEVRSFRRGALDPA